MQIEGFKWEPELKKQNHNLYEEGKKKGLNVWSSIFWSWNKIKLKWEVKWKLLSRVWLFATPWTIQPIEFFRPEYWSG